MGNFFIISYHWFKRGRLVLILSDKQLLSLLSNGIQVFQKNNNDSDYIILDVQIFDVIWLLSADKCNLLIFKEISFFLVPTRRRSSLYISQNVGWARSFSCPPSQTKMGKKTLAHSTKNHFKSNT